MLMRYWARATDSQFPVMVMVLSRLAGASLSSQLEMRIMAPESCLQRSSSYQILCWSFLFTWSQQLWILLYQWCSRWARWEPSSRVSAAGQPGSSPGRSTRPELGRNIRDKHGGRPATCRVDHSISKRIYSVDNIDRQADLSKLKYNEIIQLGLPRLYFSSYSNTAEWNSKCFFVS